jgi:hypothetical protein
VCGVVPRSSLVWQGIGKKKFGTYFLTRNIRTGKHTSKLSTKSSKMAEHIEKAKKRKRNTDGSLNPSKRVAIEEDKEVKISVQDADQWAPVIGMLELQSLSGSSF